MVRKFWLLMGGAVAAISAAPSYAQSPPPGTPPSAVTTAPTASPAPGDSADVSVSEIVVTAQRRAENLQRVPIAVTAVSGATLLSSGVTNTVQLNTIAPGLNIRTTAGAFQPTIRGVGTSSNVVENPVALYIDGVYLPFQREGLRELDDIAQIAVLKGPQGTLFGRNATGGVIQITTLAPSHDFSGVARAEIDNYATGRGSVYVTGGLTDTVAASLSVNGAGQGSGYGKDFATGRDTFQVLHDFGVRSKILFEPGPDTSFTLIADYADSRQLTNSYQPYHGLPLAFPGVGPLGSVYDSYGGRDGFVNLHGGGVSLTFNQDLPFAKLVSITSYRRAITSYLFDNSGVPGSYFVVQSPNTQNEDYTEELQLVSKGSGPFKWVLGTYYFHNSLASQPIRRDFSGPLVPLPTSTAVLESRGTEVTQSFAPFVQGTLEVLPKTNLTLGARYTVEDRSLIQASQFVQLANAVSILTKVPLRKLPAEKTTFRAALDHQFTDNILGYASYNTGFKSGGFNVLAPVAPSYLPENLRAYEIGVKSELFDHRLRLNIAGFYYDYTNLQVTEFIGVTQAVVNGPAARLYGLDLDYEVRLSQGLRLSGGLEAEHSSFKSYPNAVFSTPRPTGGALLFIGNATGDRLPLAQEFTATTSLDYHADAGRHGFDFNVTGNYNGDYFFESDNFLRQPAYVILNASIKWTLPGRAVSLTAFGKNLFDEHVITQVPAQALGYLATFGTPPRTYGLRAEARF